METKYIDSQHSPCFCFWQYWLLECSCSVVLVYAFSLCPSVCWVYNSIYVQLFVPFLRSIFLQFLPGGNSDCSIFTVPKYEVFFTFRYPVWLSVLFFSINTIYFGMTYFISRGTLIMTYLVFLFAQKNEYGMSKMLLLKYQNISYFSS